MLVRALSLRRLLPLLAGILAACSGGDVTGPVTLGDVAGRYAVTNIRMYFKSDPPFRVDAGRLDGVQVTIEATGDFTVEATASPGSITESGRISIAGSTLTVTTGDTGSVLLHPAVEQFTYRSGVLLIIQEGVPQLLGDHFVATTVTMELTKR